MRQIRLLVGVIGPPRLFVAHGASLSFSTHGRQWGVRTTRLDMLSLRIQDSCSQRHRLPPSRRDALSVGLVAGSREATDGRGPSRLKRRRAPSRRLGKTSLIVRVTEPRRPGETTR